MPQFGGYSPFPRRFGGGRPTLQSIVESILSQLGTAYDTTDKTAINGLPPLVFIRAQAIGRCIWGAWEQNQRLGNQWDANRMTDFLPRWEKIYGLYPRSTDSVWTRMLRVGVAMARTGHAAGGDIYAVCLAYLGPSVLVKVVTNSSSGSIVVWTPAGWPMGSHPARPSDPDWYSTLAAISIQVQQPATMADDEFYATVASVIPPLDSILPAWVSMSWFRQDIHGSAGFYLDEGKNLDNEAFDT